MTTESEIIKRREAVATVTKMILVLSGHYGTTPLDDECNITDFLADLMHYCKKGRLDFDAILSRSRTHFEEEK